jgi:hypothetical protein
MKTLLSFCCLLMLLSCRKELSFTATEPAIIAEPLPAPRAIDPVAFQSMLNENYQYQIVRYYSAAEDLWGAVPEWIKDDAYTFRETGEGWIDPNRKQDPYAVFHGREQSCKLYSSKTIVQLEWVDLNYQPARFTVEAFTSGQSFVLSRVSKDTTVYTEFRIWN